MSVTVLKRVSWFLNKINVELPFDPANLLDSYPREKKIFIHTHLYTDVHVSTINDTSVHKHKMDKIHIMDYYLAIKIMKC